MNHNGYSNWKLDDFCIYNYDKNTTNDLCNESKCTVVMAIVIFFTTTNIIISIVIYFDVMSNLWKSIQLFNFLDTGWIVN